MSRAFREFLDRDYIEDIDGRLFTVVGGAHPSDRVISYLKYKPSREGIKSIWSRNGVGYTRMMPRYGAYEVLKQLSSLPSSYIRYDRILGFKMIEIPKQYIRRHYIPEERLNQIIKRPRDKLEYLVRDLVLELSSYISEDYTVFGITGSILLGIHNVDYSDIDLTIYGFKNALELRKVMNDIFSNVGTFSRLKGSILERYIGELVKTYPLSNYEARRYLNETWSRGLYKGKFFSIHPVLKSDEISVRYGEQSYRGLGLIKFTAEVIDDRYSLFNPAIYRIRIRRLIKLPHIIEAINLYKITEVVSYEGIYSGIARVGECIEVSGKLERVYDIRYGSYYRVLIGSFDARGLDYIKPVRWFETTS